MSLNITVASIQIAAWVGPERRYLPLGDRGDHPARDGG